MNWHKMWFALVFAIAPSAHAGGSGPLRVMISASGTCGLLELAGRKVPCSYTTGVIYSLLKNGRVLISIGVNKNKVLSFVGSKDSQPSPENYFLYLSRIDINTVAVKSVVDVGGECHLIMSVSGKRWHSLDCTAQDANGANYILRYKFYDQPIDRYK